MPTKWAGVFPALTTKFKKNGDLDVPMLEKHYQMQIEAGVHGFVVLGSLGENGTLTPDEKQEVVKIAVAASRRKIPVLATVAETTTAGACKFVEKATANGVDGFMLLPGMQYLSDRRETIQHFRTVAKASTKPIMLYNNPVAYRIDTTPDMFAELADEPKFVAIKESSEDVRRINDIIKLVGDRYQIFIGVDDLAMESQLIGAVGWVAGLVNAFPKETVALFELIRTKRNAEALELYRWFLPLLHLDTSVKFVQYIKLAEMMVGCGTEYVRAPRMQLAGDERKRVESIIRSALKKRPTLPKV